MTDSLTQTGLVRRSAMRGAGRGRWGFNQRVRVNGFRLVVQLPLPTTEADPQRQVVLRGDAMLKVGRFFELGCLRSAELTQREATLVVTVFRIGIDRQQLFGHTQSAARIAVEPTRTRQNGERVRILGQATHEPLRREPRGVGAIRAEQSERFRR